MAATMKDLARHAGVGLGTISSYFNGGNVREKNRIAIEAAIEELHFEVNEVARGLRTNRTRTVGVVIPELGNLFCSGIITAMEDVLRTHGYGAIVCDCRSDATRQREAVEFLLRKKVDGLIVMSVSSDGADLQPFVDSGRPVVLIDRAVNGLSCDMVLVDNVEAARMAAGKLLDAGHHAIGILCGPENISTAQERLEGYRLAYQERGKTPEDRWIIRSDYTIEGGKADMKRLLQLGVSAVFATNYEMMVGAIIALNEAGLRVGEDISFIGYDSLDFACAMTPHITVVTQPLGEIGAQVAQIMLERLNGKQDAPCRMVLPCALVEGKSVQPFREPV